jgi:hypothetical protein
MLKRRPESSKTDSKRIIIRENKGFEGEEGAGSEKEENEKEKQAMSIRGERYGQNFQELWEKFTMSSRIKCEGLDKLPTSWSILMI